MIMKFDPVNWRQYEVNEPENKPKGAHFAAVMFSTRLEHTPSYNQHDFSSTTNVPEVTYYCFYNKEDLELWVAEATKTGKSFFFFHVSKLGEAKLRVDVDIDVSE